MDYLQVTMESVIRSDCCRHTKDGINAGSVCWECTMAGIYFRTPQECTKMLRTPRNILSNPQECTKMLRIPRNILSNSSVARSFVLAGHLAIR